MGISFRRGSSKQTNARKDTEQLSLPERSDRNAKRTERDKDKTQGNNINRLVELTRVRP